MFWSETKVGCGDVECRILIICNVEQLIKTIDETRARVGAFNKHSDINQDSAKYCAYLTLYLEIAKKHIHFYILSKIQC